MTILVWMSLIMITLSCVAAIFSIGKTRPPWTAGPVTLAITTNLIIMFVIWKLAVEAGVL